MTQIPHDRLIKLYQESIGRQQMLEELLAVCVLRLGGSVVIDDEDDSKNLRVNIEITGSGAWRLRAG